jgi:hypothetical protein
MDPQSLHVIKSPPERTLTTVNKGQLGKGSGKLADITTFMKITPPVRPEKNCHSIEQR